MLLTIQNMSQIRGGRLILRFSIFSQVGVSALIAVVVLGASAIHVAARDGTKDWVVLENCRLITNPANDGDSFHVRANDTEYLVRLYFVDAPETASVGPARLIEQAEYFGVSVPQVIEIGLNAKNFVDAKLSEPFTVVTRMAEGLGRSNIQRANGLARIHGVHPATPDGSSGQNEIQKLEQLEQAAKQKKLGAWAMNGQPSS